VNWKGISLTVSEVVCKGKVMFHGKHFGEHFDSVLKKMYFYIHANLKLSIYCETHFKYLHIENKYKDVNVTLLIILKIGKNLKYP
jgi:hypothetical protein